MKTQNKFNKKSKNKTYKKIHKKTHKTTQYGGNIDKQYINDVFTFLYNDIYIEEPDLKKLKNNKIDRIEYIKKYILDYDFFTKDKLKDIVIIKPKYNSSDNSDETSVNNQPPELDFDIKKYDQWVSNRFDIEKTPSRIRIVDTEPTSGHYFSPNHREFNDPEYEPMGAPYKWNVLCYYKNENCNLYNCGLGIIYKSNDKDPKTSKNIFKRVALPVIDGLTLKIRDCYFYHFTPNLEFNNKTKNKKKDIIKRIIIRSYHDYRFEKSVFCYDSENIDKLPIYQFTKTRSSITPPVRPRSHLSLIRINHPY
jgi:hypothetical protein